MSGPVLSRRHAGGAASARGLLLTVLGEFVLRDSGTAWTSVFIDVLGRLGVEEKAARQALMRTAADGWLSAERVGRRTRWRLTPSGRRMLTEGAARIYGFTGTAENWDGRWLLVLARVPDSDRRARHLVRSRLSWAGMGTFAPGSWISPYPARAEEVAGVLAEAGVEAQVFLGTRLEIGDPAEMVRQAWDLVEVDARYAEFLATFGSPATTDALAHQVELVHAWRRFPLIDPALPRALLPERWSGLRAAELFGRRHGELCGPALAEWRTLAD